MNNDYKAFVARIKAMKAGEIIDQGDNLDALYFLILSCEYNDVATKLELITEDGTPLGKKVLVVYKA